jgi:hypothetical protein
VRFFVEHYHGRSEGRSMYFGIAQEGSALMSFKSFAGARNAMQGDLRHRIERARLELAGCEQELADFDKLYPTSYKPIEQELTERRDELVCAIKNAVANRDQDEVGPLTVDGDYQGAPDLLIFSLPDGQVVTQLHTEVTEALILECVAAAGLVPTTHWNGAGVSHMSVRYTRALEKAA